MRKLLICCSPYTASGRQTGSIDFSVANAISLNVVGDAPKWTGFDTGAGYLQNGGYNKDARGSLSSVWKSETLNAWTTTNWQLQVNVGKPTGYTDGDSVLFDDSVLTAGRTTAAVAGDSRRCGQHGPAPVVPEPRG